MIKKVYEVDPLICPNCHGQMKVIAFIKDLCLEKRKEGHHPFKSDGPIEKTTMYGFFCFD